jgi:hypothetical protein
MDQNEIALAVVARVAILDGSEHTTASCNIYCREDSCQQVRRPLGVATLNQSNARLLNTQA